MLSIHPKKFQNTGKKRRCSKCSLRKNTGVVPGLFTAALLGASEEGATASESHGEIPSILEVYAQPRYQSDGR